MSKVKKRIRPTKEQAQEFNCRLDAVVEAGHTNNLYCDCELCRALAEQAELIGYREDSTIKQPSNQWERRRREAKRKRQIDVVKVANLAGQGLTFAEISRKMHRSKDYINKVARDFDIKIFTKKER